MPSAVDEIKKINLVGNTINEQDIASLIEWLSTNPRLTKGPLTIEFEQKWAKKIGVKHALYVNSGSSANLLMLYALIAQGLLKPGDKVAVPALSWATDLAPVMQLGLKPVLIDCNIYDLSISLDHFESVIENQKIKALMLVSVLGLVPSMDYITDICKKNGVILLEDACESLGSEFEGKMLGSFGLMSSFSLYFGHHLSTIEGGMICTDDETVYETLLQLRSHGWDRDLPEHKQKEFRDKWAIDDFSALYSFYLPGFNLRATDLQAKIGIGQLDKLDTVVNIRERNYRRYVHHLKDLVWTPHMIHSHKVSNMAMPIIDDGKKDMVKKLQDNGIEARPLICGSMGTQPCYVKEYGVKTFKNASLVDQKGFYVPNNHELSLKDVDRVCGLIIQTIREKG